MYWLTDDGIGRGYFEGFAGGGKRSRALLLVKGWVANGSKELRVVIARSKRDVVCVRSRGWVDGSNQMFLLSLYRRTEETEENAGVYGPSSSSDPLFRLKATLVALSRSSGPGVGNRGRSVTQWIFPSHSGLPSHGLSSSRHSVRPISFQSAKNHRGW